MEFGKHKKMDARLFTLQSRAVASCLRSGKEQVQQLMAKQGEAPKADKSEKKKKQERSVVRVRP